LAGRVAVALLVADDRDLAVLAKVVSACIISLISLSHTLDEEKEDETYTVAACPPTCSS
jgi:uncharacterized membrane protein